MEDESKSATAPTEDTVKEKSPADQTKTDDAKEDSAAPVAAEATAKKDAEAIKKEEGAEDETKKEDSDKMEVDEEMKKVKEQEAEDEAKEEEAKDEAKEEEAKNEAKEEEAKNEAKEEEAKDEAKEEVAKDEAKEGEAKLKAEDKDDDKMEVEEETKKDGKATKVPTDSRSRQRKTAESYEPEDFKNKVATIEIRRGRGKTLEELPTVRDAIKKGGTATADLVTMVHKLVFPARGKFPVPAMKEHLLAFSGYLEPFAEDEDGNKVSKEEQDEIDDEAETKVAQKVLKLKIPQLRTVCDFLLIDRTDADGKTVSSKEDLVDKLMDFLSAPHPKYLRNPKKSPKKSPAATKKAAAKKTPEKETKASTPKKRKSTTPKSSAKKKKKKAEDGSDEDTEEEEDGDGIPSKKKLREWVKAYVACFNMDKVTTNHAVETASDKFGVDLKGQKAEIKKLLMAELD